ncbi:MAG: HicB family protein [Clostridiales bacterium]|nr:HicB family protein [Clostridiales bacterium]
MKKAYPIIISPTAGGYSVYIPDFDINTQGADIPDAIFMARDAIGLVGIDMQDDGEALPEAAPLESIRGGDEDIVSLVDVDFAEYRRRHDNRVVRKNLTIPSWLNEEGIARGINFSQVLQEALIEKLGV